jgi:hypothetical protein
MSLYIVPDIERLLPLALTNHCIMTLLLYEFPVFLSFHSNKPLLQFRHWFLVSYLAFNIINFVSSQCPNLFDCQLVFFTSFSHFHFCVEINQCPFLCRLLLQINEKVKIFGYFTTNGMAFHFCWEKHSASKSNSVVWVGT